MNDSKYDDSVLIIVGVYNMLCSLQMLDIAPWIENILQTTIVGSTMRVLQYIYI